MTSAPITASIFVAIPPEMPCEKSSTLMPSKGEATFDKVFPSVKSLILGIIADVYESVLS